MTFEISRTPKKLFKSHIDLLPKHGIMPFSRTTGHPKHIEQAYAALMESQFVLSDSNLWKGLDPAFGPCDGMVPGKYRKARAFCFESPHLYIWCHTETGDRGTGWFFAEKNAQPLVKRPWSYTYFDFGENENHLIEVAEALTQIFAKAIEAHPTLGPDIDNMPIIAQRMAQNKALAELALIDAATPEPNPAKPNVRRKMI